MQNEIQLFQTSQGNENWFKKLDNQEIGSMIIVTEGMKSMGGFTSQGFEKSRFQCTMMHMLAV